MPSADLTQHRASLPARYHAPSVAACMMLLAALGFVLATAILSPLKDDVAWLLYVARKWLGGQRLYEDLVEVNPPLIIWIYAIPAWISQHFNWEPKLVAIPFFAALVLASAWWTACLLHGRAALFAHRLPSFAVIGTLLLLLPGVEFGQREHLLAASVLPYLVLFVRELEGEREPRWTALAVGALAGLGCALKPTYAIAFVLMELAGALRGHRLFRISSLSAAGTALIYAAAVVIFDPAFLQKAVPLALALYGGTDTPCLQIMWESRRLLFGQGVVLVLYWVNRETLARYSPFLRHTLLALTVFAVGATISYVLQGKNWFYHQLPATTAIVLALLLWLAILLVWRDLPRRRVLLTAPLLAISLVDFTLAGYDRMRPWVVSAVEPNLSTEVKLERLIKREKAHTYIAFSEWIALGFPVVNDTGVTWASRFDSMWALKGELWRARQDGGASKDFPVRDWVVKDFVANCPDIAVVDTKSGVNYVGVLIGSSPEFARAWSHYREIANFDRLRVLKRDSVGCTAPNTANRQHASAMALEQP